MIEPIRDCSNNPLIYWDPTGHWQQGDEQYPAEVQAELMALTNAYWEATTQAEKEQIANEAKNLRSIYSQHIENYNDNSPANASFVKEVNGIIDKKTYLTEEEWFEAFEKKASGTYKKETNSITIDDGMVQDTYGTTVYKTTVKGYTNIVTSEKLLYGPTNVSFGWTVTDVYYINDQNDLPVFGHSALLMKRADGSAMYYSYMSFAPRDLKDGIAYAGGIPNEGFLGKSYVPASKTDNFLASGSLGGNSLPELGYYSQNDGTYTLRTLSEAQKYDRYIMIPTTSDESAKMLQKAEENFWEKNDTYMLYENNCNFVAQQILGAGSKNFTHTYGSTMNVYQNIWGIITGETDFIKALEGKWNDETIPNGAYEIGVQMAKTNGWTIGRFKK